MKFVKKGDTAMKTLKKPILGFFFLMSLPFLSDAQTKVDSEDIKYFIEGATIMAAGGGGSAQIARSLSAKYFSPEDVVFLYAVGETIPGNHQKAAAVGAIGSPASIFSLIEPLGLPLNARRGLSVTFNAEDDIVSFLMPIEVGAINGLFPFLLANKISKENGRNIVNILDVDGGGRSVPTLPLLIYSYYPNIYNQDAVVTSRYSKIDNDKKETPTEYARLHEAKGDQGRIESIILAMLDENSNTPYEGVAGYGSFYATASDITEDVSITGQISIAIKVGLEYSKAHTGSNIVNALDESNRSAKAIFSGNVTKITLNKGSLDDGVVTVTGTGAYAKDIFTIYYENENICAYKQSYSTEKPFVLGPDSVAYVPVSGTAFDNSDLYKIVNSGSEPAVDIVAIKALDKITNNSGIMDAWSNVRQKDISDGRCNFPYTSPWMSTGDKE